MSKDRSISVKSIIGVRRSHRLSLDGVKSEGFDYGIQTRMTRTERKRRTKDGFIIWTLTIER